MSVEAGSGGPPDDGAEGLTVVESDINHDDAVDSTDLSVFMMNWSSGTLGADIIRFLDAYVSGT